MYNKKLFKVIDLEDIQLKSLNNKFTVSRNSNRICLKKEYEIFKHILSYSIGELEKPLDPPYFVYIYMETYLDIDNPLKPILDTLEGPAIQNDRQIRRLLIDKIPRKRGHPSMIQVYVGSMKGVDHWKLIFPIISLA